MSAFKYFTMMECPHRRVLQQTTQQKPWKQAWTATARLQGRCKRERERRRFKLNAWQHARQLCVNYGVSLTIAWQGRLRVTLASDLQTAGCWLQVRVWHDHSYIAGIPLLAHSLTVKLSPCSHSSLAGQMLSCANRRVFFLAHVQRGWLTLSAARSPREVETSSLARALAVSVIPSASDITWDTRNQYTNRTKRHFSSR